MKYDNEKQFSITGVCRSDLHNMGIDTETLTDENMEDIARLLGESYLEGNGSFWNDLESIAIDVYKLKQHDM